MLPNEEKAHRREYNKEADDRLIPIATAARILGTSVKAVHDMCRSGLLQPVYKKLRGKKHFPADEISALAEVRQQNLELPGVATLAIRALVTAKANERRLDELFRILGLKRKTLDTTTTEVVSLYERARLRLENPRQPELQELEEWAENFYAIDENYLLLVERYTASQEPWKVFLDLAGRLANNRIQDLHAILELRMAYEHIEAARRHLRIVSYMFCRQTKGVSIADAVFGGEKVTDHLLAMVFATS